MPEVSNAGNAATAGGTTVSPVAAASEIKLDLSKMNLPDKGNVQLENKQPEVKKEVAPKIDNGIREYFGKKVKLGSRKVTIKLVSKFSILPKDAGAQFIRDEVIKKIGSTWKAGTRDIIRGLSPEEELVYLPRILGVRVESDQWNEKVLTHWCDFTIPVPNNDKGVEFEAGFKEIVTNTGLKVEPINLDDYMKFNFCREHSAVATEPEQLDNSFTYTFFMVDKQKESELREKEFELRQEVEKYFIKLVAADSTESSAKVDWILETSGGPNRNGMNIQGYSKMQKNMALEELKNANLSKFLDIVKDDHLQTKALIRKAVTVGVLQQEGNSFFYDAKVIGSSLLGAVGWLSDAANQKDKLIILERIKAY